MRDQADELRRLVLRAAASHLAPEAPPPPLVVVTGGKGGVGATTVAVNLAVAFSRQGRRAVLVDADFHQPDATELCGVKEGDSVSDVLSGRRTVHEVLQPGPAGIQVVPGSWAPQRLTEVSAVAQQRMLAELGRLGPHADVVVLDVGSGPTDLTRRFWESARQVILVTTGESAAIMDTYATIKLLGSGGDSFDICTLVNRAADDDAADEVQARIGQACSRFLGLLISGGPHLPAEPHIAEAAQTHRPFLLQSPTCVAAQRVELLGEQVLDRLTAQPVAAAKAQKKRPGESAA